MRIKSWLIPFLFILLCGAVMSRWVQGVDFETNMSTNAMNSSSAVHLDASDPGDILGSILINARTTGAETIKVFDSSATSTGLIGTINLSTGAISTAGAATANEYVYNLRVSSGITITKSASGADVTVIWKNVR